eukprot:scaffold9866_cov136-Skeletonema_marinoi.AAC.2
MTTPRVSSEHVNGMWKGRFPWLRMIPNKIKNKKTLKRTHVKSWEREQDRLSDIADPDRAPSDGMPEEERVLCRGVLEGAPTPKDWRRDTLKEYLREHHAAFEFHRRDMVDDESSDEDMEDLLYTKHNLKLTSIDTTNYYLPYTNTA